MMQINVTGGALDRRELDAYVARANSRYPVGTVRGAGPGEAYLKTAPLPSGAALSD